MNGRVLGVALGLVGVMTMLFGLVPAVLLVRRSMGADLRSGERGSSRTARGLYQGLVIAEVALACALLVGSVLLIRTVGRDDRRANRRHRRERHHLASPVAP